MDQNLAKRLFVEGGVLIFLGVPVGTEFGIDLKSWNTEENFRGVKMIPPGLHYIFYSSVSNTGDIAPRAGFFHNFKKSEVLVKKWDKETEDLSEKVVGESEVVGLKDNIIAMDRFLGPYPYDILERWKNLTSNITESVVNKLVPKSGIVRSALEMVSCSDLDRPRAQNNSSSSDAGCSNENPKRLRYSLSGSDSESDLLPVLKPKEGTDLQFTQLPTKNYPDGSTPSEITQHSLDSTFVLETLIQQYMKPLDLLGEIELCYVCFLVGHSLEAFEQWKKLVGLFCSCEKAIKKYRQLYDVFVTLLELQIKEIPEEFLADIVENNNFVYVKLRNLFRVVCNVNVDGRLKTKMERFKRNLTDLYGWDFGHLDSDEEDEAPVVVELINGQDTDVY